MYLSSVLLLLPRIWIKNWENIEKITVTCTQADKTGHKLSAVAMFLNWF